jgi:hypothetical protein
LFEKQYLTITLILILQVVRGVIPGAGPQAEYHPNPYLQHLYARNAGENTNQVRGENPEEVNNALRDLEELQEVISQNDTAEGELQYYYFNAILANDNLICLFQ